MNKFEVGDTVILKSDRHNKNRIIMTVSLVYPNGLGIECKYSKDGLVYSFKDSPDVLEKYPLE